MRLFEISEQIMAKSSSIKPCVLTMKRKPDLSHFHVFVALCYPNNDSEDLGKLKPKADIGIFIDYAPAKKAYRIYNKRTRLIIETIYVDFDELEVMASKQFSSGPRPQLMTPKTLSSGLVSNPPSSTLYVAPTQKDLDTLFQPMFDEYFNPPPGVTSPVPIVVALDPTNSHLPRHQLIKMHHLQVVTTPEVQSSSQRSKDSINISIFRIVCLWQFDTSFVRIAESDSDDEEEYEIKRNKFGAPIYGLKPASYLNCNDPAERSLALRAVINPLWKISVWKKAISFLGSLHVLLQHASYNETGCISSSTWGKRYLNTVVHLIILSLKESFETAQERIACLGEALKALNKEYVAWIRGKLIQKHILNQKCMGYLVHVYYNISPTRYYKDDSWRSADLKLNEKQILVNFDMTSSTFGMTTLKELIDSEGRLIHEDPHPSVQRVSIPRPPKASIQDLYEMMCNMEIRQGAIERMSYRNSYHWDRYTGVFKHMAGVYSVPLQGAYNPPGYAQP
uniref:Retroviral polymerase SH3-like domain-containing protein n=1 Tax=Tanacetum cinerariifolium TaxID=118510 RepID=A0A6L2K492_TANCI|nr:hypothetical protein [Tanacetum cinerariifolium]